MSKIIAVIGSTGAQGGGVANILLKTPGWKVRAITRNVNSGKAKELISRGAEAVAADLDDEESLVKAFEGAHAVYGVTNYWEHIAKGKSQTESGEAEAAQAMLLARAVARAPSVEHYIFSTLPNAKKITQGKVEVPHLDYKAEVDERMKKELPELAKKTTFLYYGYYPTNMVTMPNLKPIEYPYSGKHVQFVPTPADALVPTAGDLTVTPGIWVRQILANADKTRGKYAMVAPEVITFGEILKIWSEVSGKDSLYVEVSKQSFEDLWGIGGNEFGRQLHFGEVVPDWTAHLGSDYVSKEQLGITEQNIGVKAALESMKSSL
ncbi:hypothetical protein NX059_005217 [Plenodomus lindquistii]|nr:hypothetical protein NX059_005217 [Plenodomus lindquistii]